MTATTTTATTITTTTITTTTTINNEDAGQVQGTRMRDGNDEGQG